MRASSGGVLLSYDATVLVDVPLTYYKLAEVSGTTITDSSGFTNGATLSGGGTVNQAGIFTGNPKSYLFANSGLITSSHGIWATNYLGPLSVECFFNLSSLSVISGLLGDNDSGNWGIEASVATTGALSFRVVMQLPGIAAISALTSTGVVSAGVAYHFVGVWDPAVGITIYLNGSQVAFTASTTNTKMRNPNNQLWAATAVAAADATLHAMSGNLSNVAWYATALSASRAAAHYAARNAP